MFTRIVYTDRLQVKRPGKDFSMFFSLKLAKFSRNRSTSTWQPCVPLLESALEVWIPDILCCDPTRSRALLRVLSTEGRGVRLCLASLKPKGPFKTSRTFHHQSSSSPSVLWCFGALYQTHIVAPRTPKSYLALRDQLIDKLRMSPPDAPKQVLRCLGALVLCIKPTSSPPVLQISILHYEISHG